MVEKNEKENIALLIDHQNLFMYVKNNLKSSLDFTVFDEIVEDINGIICIGRCYFALGMEQGSRQLSDRICYELYRRGIEVRAAPTLSRDKGSNIADFQMYVEAIDILYTNNNIDHFLIVTSDKDFIPLLRKIKEKGKKVTLIGTRNISNNLTRECTRLEIEIKSFDEYHRIVKNLKKANDTN